MGIGSSIAKQAPMGEAMPFGEAEIARVCLPTMKPSDEVVILANPYSGKGQNRQKVDALAAALRARDFNSRQVWDLQERAELLADPGVGERYRCIVSAGGDGSMAAVVNDLGQGGSTTRIAIAMLPIGNENLFAKAFGYNRGITELADAIDRLRTRDIDVGRAGDRLFTLMASVGFDSEVVRQVDMWRRADSGSGLKRVSRLSYARPIIHAMRSYDYPEVVLTSEGKQVCGAHAFIFNIGQYGGGLPIGRHADATDAQLDWVVFKRPGLLRLGWYGLQTYLRQHLKRGDVICGRTSQLSLSSEAPLPVQADGDPCGLTPCPIQVLPAAMRIVQALP